MVKSNEQAQDAKVASLVKIYENMKPKDAARIFEALDMDTLLLVAERMKERKLAPVMAQMNSERAKDITVELTRAGQLPLPGGG
jgi:flagellar motility protein MotE (MotC chaperone)